MERGDYVSYYIYAKPQYRKRQSGHVRPEAIHSVIRTLANCNFAIYIFGGLIGIDYETWIDVAMAGNIIIMLIMAGMND